MCGIAGFNWADPSLIAAMTKKLEHRGPDDEGAYVDENVSIGNRRLAILDTSEKGHQPMRFEHLVITFNGEMYNFMEIKEQLLTKGYRFNSGTDTEVILYAYHLWGPACIEKSNGMWGLCIYDGKARTLFLSRDRFGIKPVYFYFDGAQFIFASELKAIRCHALDLKVDEAAVNFYLYQKYIGNDLTIFKNCHKLKPGENLVFDLDSKTLTRTKYFDLEAQVGEQQTIPLARRLDSVEGLLVDSVEKRLVADVPVGSFLSGGLDSSLISAIIARKHKGFTTFSIGFKEKTYDELRYSIQAAEHIHTDHSYEYAQITDDDIQRVLDSLDEPFGDSSVLPTYLVSRLARRTVTACLSGDGGDEVFGGYDTYKAYKLACYVPGWAVSASKRFVDLLPASDTKVGVVFKLKRFVDAQEVTLGRRHLDWMCTWSRRRRHRLMGDHFIAAESFIEYNYGEGLLSLQLNDIHNYLAEDILKKVDIASMLNSLEARVPLLDCRLVPLVLSLPEEYKIRMLTTKWLLKRIGSKYLPGGIVHRPKKGFTAPIGRWIRTKDLIREFLGMKKYYEHGLLDYDYVQSLFKAHLTGTQDWARQLWLVFVLNYWWRRRYRNTEVQWP
jgi:asparagine synthase (glutamine-hydrolysing)